MLVWTGVLNTDYSIIMYYLYLVFLFLNDMFCSCQTSSLVINVVEVVSQADVKLVCNISSSTNLTRWTYLSGSTGTSLMSYQNGECTLSPSDSFLSDSRYSYTCNSTVYQVIMHPFKGSWNNHVLACRDAVEPDRSGSTWVIKEVQDGDQCNCYQTIPFSVREVREGDNDTFICRVSSGIQNANWNINFGSNTAVMGAQNGQCTTQGTTFLDNTSKYIYTCNRKVYQVTILNVRRSQHNEMYMCTPVGQEKETGSNTGSNWIIKVEAPVTSVTMTPYSDDVNILRNMIENTLIEFICTTSTARPAASVYWYRHPNGKTNDITHITENITTKTDYNDLSVITSTLHFVLRREHSQTMIYCTANNSVNTNPVPSNKNIFLNILYKADDPYILQGNEYRVTEHTSVRLTCTVRGGNPIPTLSWSCNNFLQTHPSTIYSNGNVTTTFTWNVSRTHEGTCTCTSTSTQNDFTTETKDVSVVVEYEVSHPSFSINGLTNKIVNVNESTAVTFICNTDGNPPPTMTLTNGSNVFKSGTSRRLEHTLSHVSCQDLGTYSCSARNHLNAHPVVSSIDLIVHCSPRPIEDMDATILSGIRMTAKIIVEVVAYPTPSFTWWSQKNDQWKMIQTTDRRLINSSELVSSLTIDNVNEDDFTSYKVVAENNVGNMERIYKLHDGSPHMPTQLRYFEALSTSSSIQLAWTPGYNGGSKQIFYIKYRATDESSWNYKTVSDDLEQTRIYTLTNLKDNMYYYIIVLTSNQYGNSTESSLLFANTKAFQPKTRGGIIWYIIMITSIPIALIGGIISCFVGGKRLVEVITRKCPLLKRCFQRLDCRKGDGTNQPPAEQVPLNDVRDTNGANNPTEDTDSNVIQMYIPINNVQSTYARQRST